MITEKKRNTSAFLGSTKNLLAKSGPLLALVLIAAILTVTTDNFLTARNLMNVIRQAASNGFVALGMMACILTGGIDLSVGSIVAISCMLSGMAAQAGVPGVICVGICIGVGIICGIINGLLLTKLKLPHPFISTMGTQNVLRGAALLVTAGVPISGMPYALNWAGSAYIANKIPVSLVLMLAAYLIFALFLRRTRLGRHIYAIGGNSEAARLSGISVNRVRLWAYTISGFTAALGAIILIGRTDSAYPNAGLTWENDAIAAVIIGGTSFSGGRGNALGTFVGVLLIAVLRNGLNLLNVTANMQTVVLGFVIIIAVFIDVVRSGAFKSVRKKVATS